MRKIEKHLLDHFTQKECLPIFYGYSGSLAHGTYIPEISSNINLFIVLQYPKQYYYGLGEIELNSSGNYSETINDILYDVEYFEITKFLTLLLNNSPNCINYLFINKDDRIIWNSKLWNYIENNYTEFVSQKYVISLKCWAERMIREALSINEEPNFKKIACSYQYITMALEYITDRQIRTNRTYIDADKIKFIKLKKEIDFDVDRIVELIDETQSYIEELLKDEIPDYLKHLIKEPLIPYNKINRTEIENHLNIILWTLNHQDENCNE